MRKSLYLLALGAFALGACHTTEANYRAAYDVAKARAAQRAADADDVDPEIQAKLDAVKRGRQSVYIVGKDTLTVTTRFLSRVDSVDAVLPEFSVAVNGFEQKFNAMAMMRRLRDNGFPGAYVARNSDQVFYVIAAGTDTVGRVPMLINNATEGTAGLGLAAGYPIVLRNPNRRK
ncbi:MAG: hypothetical protein K2O38_07870 [Muribaculaceae bacterium]|nr:hypothetical protein [Muribaculaceae bacterium]MDE7111800.1 hypothetical protein [Muribaculaceae bacterium]